MVLFVSLPLLVFTDINPALAGTIQYGGHVGTNSSGGCGSSSVALNPVEDTYVAAASPTTNFGSATSMWVRTTSAAGGLARSLLRFDLPPVPAGCSLASAQMRVNLTSSNGGTTHSIYRAGSAWSESTTTWDTQPGVTGSAATGNPTSSTGWHEYQVTSQVGAMYQTTNNGFVIRNEQAQDRSHQIVSREGASPPELVLSWGIAPTTTTPITVPAGGVPAGNSIVVTFAIDPWAVGPVSASDSKGNTYSLDATGTHSSAGRTFVLSAHNVNALVPGDIITITHPLTYVHGGTANHYSGLAPTNTRDGTSSSSGFDASPTAGSVSTTAPDELIIGSFVVEGFSAAFTPGAGYTTLPQESMWGYWKLATEHRIVSSTGTYSATGTLEAAHNWAGAMATYKMDTEMPVVAITNPSDGADTDDPTPDITGTSGSLNSDSTTVTVKIYSGGSVSGSPLQTLTATRDVTGAWSVSADALADGTYTAVAEQEDGAENTGVSDPVTFNIDTIDPAPPAITGPNTPDNETTVQWGFTGEPGATFECRLEKDGSVLSTDPSCTSPSMHTLVDGDGTYEFHVRQMDAAGNVSIFAQHNYELDTDFPETQIDAGPMGPTNNPDPFFFFSSDESGATFECELDGSGFTPCNSPVSYTSLADGDHTFKVRAVDIGGNVDDTPAERTFSVDTMPSDVPALTGPLSPSNDTTPEWTFTGDADATFECRLEKGGSIVSALGSCSSPKTYTLSDGDGTYSFFVRQIDPAGNPSGFAQHDFELDTDLPETQIDAGPAGPVNSADASFDFSSDEMGSTFECEFDGSGFTACNPPRDHFSLAEGDHTFRVRATDPAGNTDDTPAESTFTVDTIVPEAPSLTGPTTPGNNSTPEWSFTGESDTTFECRLEKEGAVISALATCTSPTSFSLTDGDGTYTFFVRQTDAAGNSSSFAQSDYELDTDVPETQIDSGPSGPTNSADPSFDFSSDEGGVTFECELDGSGFAPCSSPEGYTSLADGDHTFRVRAVDPGGNVDDSPAERMFTVDTGVPAVPGLSGPASPGNDTSPEWSFTGEPGTTFECRLEKGGAVVSSLSTCTDPKEYTLNDGDGTYTFFVRQVDAAGNASGFASHDYTLDTGVPDAPQITGPPANGSSPDVALTFETESGTQAECKLVKGFQLIEDWTPCSAPETYTLVDGDGTYTFLVRQTDDAGNISPEASQDYDLDTRVPDTQVDSGPSGLTNDASPSFGFSSDEAGAGFECEMDGSGFTPCNSPKEYSSLSDGDHTFRVRAVDAANNTDQTPAVRSFTLDTGAPPVSIDSGPPDISNNRTPQWDFSSEPGAALQCELSYGGLPLSPFAGCNSGTAGYDLAGESDGTYMFRVFALDAAGNLSEAWDTYLLDTGNPDSVAWSTSTTASPNITVTYTYADGLSQVTEVELWAKGPADAGFSLVATDTSPASASFDYTLGQGDGEYQFYTRALDEAGNREDASVADSSTILDTAGPTTTITSSPPAQTSTGPFDFTFSSSDGSASYECSLTMDGSDAYIPCGTPISYPDAGQGVYTFKVRAADAAGNVGEPATYTFVYATSEPTEMPTEQPTEMPTDFPTEQPTERPTELPTIQPTEHPTTMPTGEPTLPPRDLPPIRPIDDPAAPSSGGGGGSESAAPGGPERPRKEPDRRDARDVPEPKDDSAEPQPDEEKPEEDLATLAKVAVEAFAFPLLLAILVALYLLVQYWLDRKDPKLAMAPVHSKHDLARFS